MYPPFETLIFVKVNGSITKIIEPKLENQFENGAKIISDELNDGVDPWLQKKEEEKMVEID